MVRQFKKEEELGSSSKRLKEKPSSMGYGFNSPPPTMKQNSRPN